MILRIRSRKPAYPGILFAMVATLCVIAAAAVPNIVRADGVAANGGALFSPPPLTAPKGVFVGKASTINGHMDSGAGRYAISARLGKADWFPVTDVSADGDGDFSFLWTPPKSGRFDFRVTPLGASSSSAVESTGSVSVYRRQKTTWYGPGFYGARTACGKKLTRRTIGVAHRRLPCGTKVEFFHAGRRIVVPVIDRGPFVRGVYWDLTYAAMKRLGSSSTIAPGVLPLR